MARGGGGGIGKILIIGLVIGGGYIAYKKGVFNKLGSVFGGASGSKGSSGSGGSYGGYLGRRRGYLTRLNTGYDSDDYAREFP